MAYILAGRVQNKGLMDRVIKRKRFTVRKILFIVIPIVTIGILIFFLFREGSASKLNVEKDRLTIATVSEGTFNEYIAVDGSVQPIKTIFLDAVEGGRIEEVFVEDGMIINEGQPILKLSNSQLELDLMTREEQLFNEKTAYNNSIFNKEKVKLTYEEQIKEIEHNMKDAKRLFLQDSILFGKGHIASNEYKKSSEQYYYLKDKLRILRKKKEQEHLNNEWQIEQFKASVELKQKNYNIVQENINRLTIKAPAKGQLTAFNSEIGELKIKGQNLGQIDVLDGFKVKASIDEHYISRINIGQTATIAYAGKTYELVVKKVYSQVNTGKFEADLEFTNELPQGIKRGQSVQVKLQLGNNSNALLLKRGGFYQSTGGNWVYVLDDTGQSAEKRPVRIGRQNPEYFEIIEGLKKGEKVITSSYEVYENTEKLILK